MVGEQHRDPALGLEPRDLHRARLREQPDALGPIIGLGQAIDRHQRRHLALEAGIGRAIGGFDEFDQIVPDQPRQSIGRAVLQIMLQRLEIAVAQSAREAADGDLAHPHAIGQRHRRFECERRIMRQDMLRDRPLGAGIIVEPGL